MFAAYLFHVNMMLIKIVQDVNVLQRVNSRCANVAAKIVRTVSKYFETAFFELLPQHLKCQ